MSEIKRLSILALLLLSACSSGSSSTTPPPPTSVTGTATPPVAPFSGTNYAAANMLTPPNSGATWPGVTQVMDYDFDAGAAGAGTLKVTTLLIWPVDTDPQGYLTLTTGAAYPSDSTLGAPIKTEHRIGNNVYFLSNGNLTIDTLAGLPSTVLTAPSWIDMWVLPYSTTLNPAGYTYQTFGILGMDQAISSALPFKEACYSVGVTTSPATLPTSGSAGYAGQATASYVDTVSRDPYDVDAAVNVSVDLATRTVTFATTGTTALSGNSTPGSLPAAATNLDMSGTLSYSAGTNTFTGVVTTGSGMSGSVTGRLYGPGIAAATPNKVIGSSPEIGGTFVLMKSGMGVLQGSFGGK